MNLSNYIKLIRNLESEPRRLQAHYSELESMIESCMDEVFRLANTGEDDDRKMRIVRLEKRGRELLENWHPIHQVARPRKGRLSGVRVTNAAPGASVLLRKPHPKTARLKALGSARNN